MKNKKSLVKLAALATLSVLLIACGSDGDDGAPGASGLESLVALFNVAPGNESCFSGGVQVASGLDANANGELDSDEINESSVVCNATTLNTEKNFNRIATFPVCLQIDATCDDDTETSAEIIASSTDGNTLIYTDSPTESIGFIDITDPENPTADGTLMMDGEPTSVAVKGDYALVGVNLSADFINVAGELTVVNIATQTAIRDIDLGGQPDSVAVSPDGNFAAVVIENERDEDLGDGAPPQLPAGSFVILDISDADPANWSASTLDLTGLTDLFPTDPEPEFVDINSDNIAVVTLQENNYLVLVDLSTGEVTNHFSAGTLSLTAIDTEEEDPALVSLTDSQDDVPREPDGVAWINTQYFATADEGDLNGGSRSFTVFNTEGDVVYTSGNDLDHMAVRFGHYPDGRSGNKGSEPENIEMGIFGGNRYLFVNSERSSLVFVYDVANPVNPVFKQVLPAALGPEGALAIPSRNLLAVASEEDARDDKFRGGVNLYAYANAPARYPTLESADKVDGTPIHWSALSGLSADPQDDETLYAVLDSFYQQNRILKIDISGHPAVVVDEILIRDTDDVLAATTTDAEFDATDLAALINADKTINLDPEGVAALGDGFVIVSEGAGTYDDVDRPIASRNFLLVIDEDGVIEEVAQLPAPVNAVQLRFGFEGVAVYNDDAYVAFQRVWDGDTDVRIGVYDPDTSSWTFLFYPLDAAASQAGGWVGLSDITSLGGGEFLVIERDNQGGPDAAIKRLYTFDVTGLVDGDTVTKTLVRDLMDDLAEAGGLIPEKIEGSAVTANGDVWIVNDNDGVDDNSGETLLLNLGDILP